MPCMMQVGSPNRQYCLRYGVFSEQLEQHAMFQAFCCMFP
jgi:hypothetical protein